MELINLPLLNLVVLGIICAYLSTKFQKHASVRFLLAAIIPLLLFQIGSYFFLRSPTSSPSAAVIVVVVVGLLPIGFVPLSLRLGRSSINKHNIVLPGYYLLQVAVLVVFTRELYAGNVVEWVTGILDEPVILIRKQSTYWFINVIASCVIALLGFESTLRHADKIHKEGLKLVLIAFVGLILYFMYFSTQVIVYSYISKSMLLSGAIITSLGLTVLGYSFARYPFWEVNIVVSRQFILGSLTFTVAGVYLFLSGNVIALLRLLQPQRYDVLLPASVFISAALVLFIYLSPNLRAKIESFLARHFFKNKYDYRDLWMKFSERSSGALSLVDLMPRVAEFIADAMFVQQVTIWLRPQNSDTLTLAYKHQSGTPRSTEMGSLRLKTDYTRIGCKSVYPVENEPAQSSPIESSQELMSLGVERYVLVEKGDMVLGLLGIGADIAGIPPTEEDDRLLASMSNQLAHLIMNEKLSEELLLVREWESFNRFSSFILHDLKNLATLQSMTLENAKTLKDNPEFLRDAFSTFEQTTDKMINLIASLSVQRGQVSLKQQPINVLEVIRQTFDGLKVQQRDGIKVVTRFPPHELAPLISGDPELLQKAFTNILLNAIQSLPKGEGSLEITVDRPANGKVKTAISDTGCGISPEQLQNLFRPFQTTKKRGMGIGLCHTRSIIEIHGGNIRIESKVNFGTKVEVELPAL